jgi:hypothetical protein
MLQAEPFQFVLDASPLQDEEPLGEVGISNCTIFRCCRVENSTLWLPVLFDGETCFRNPALRPREFAQTLDELIRGRESKVAVTAA